MATEEKLSPSDSAVAYYSFVFDEIKEYFAVNAGVIEQLSEALPLLDAKDFPEDEDLLSRVVGMVEILQTSFHSIEAVRKDELLEDALIIEALRDRMDMMNENGNVAINRALDQLGVLDECRLKHSVWN